MFIIDALVAVLVRATDEFSRAAFYFGAGEFADTLTASVRAGCVADECVEVENFIFKKAVRRGCWMTDLKCSGVQQAKSKCRFFTFVL